MKLVVKEAGWNKEAPEFYTVEEALNALCELVRGPSDKVCPSDFNCHPKQFLSKKVAGSP